MSCMYSTEYLRPRFVIHFLVQDLYETEIKAARSLKNGYTRWLARCGRGFGISGRSDLKNWRLSLLIRASSQLSLSLILR